ncbi:Acetyl-CoA carboxylase [Gracilariopsis chorda]|uniref:Acetyl-CoA carboxylase n=1 Tax=Gracilariopsis chorda TaxID=448386 RepID=A0A2V3J2N7_9FLOR|nr:Acetyl-CoA carboxylase [Gracilariopsis chorda]|eukprot:PXF48372.1 Acetyl-CoA carboxylase [Gracilariopsis chorda]
MTTSVISPQLDPETTSLQNYVKQLGGKRVIRKILIANNGIAAVKAIRSIRRWCYETFGNERTIEFVSMATPEDVAANAEYVRMADMWTSVPGGSNNHNFANVELICDLAYRFACDAVWAGWGHASENPNLPARLSEMGITFLGPNPKSMHALGDKIASTIIAQSAGVPTVAWSGRGLLVNYKAQGGVPVDVYQKACVLSAEHAKKVAEECGYPIVVKASEGGGGKGIRVVFEEAAICTAYRQVASEVPGSPIFLMRLVQNARHLEVQIVADEYGDAIALYGRDCSVQRRHQKIIEEGPVVAAPPNVWKGLEKAAVALAKEVGYVGAGTVEYLYKGDKTGGEFYFLELNPRLQVEHPVTEWITGVNLPALQLHIGMGIPMKNVATIRKFLRLPDGPLCDDPVTSPIALMSSPARQASAVQISDVSSSDHPEPLALSPMPPHGHVIACRVTAENPDEGFQPTSGAIQELTFRNTPNVWGYFSVGASGGVHEFADSQFGHLFAWGENRESSRRSLVLALKELSIRGDIRTTVEYLIKLLEMQSFRENQISTSWLDSLIAEKVAAEKPPTDLAVIIGAVCRAHMMFSERAELFTLCLERGQLPPLDHGLVDFPVQLIYDNVKYCFVVTRADVSAFRVRLADDERTSESARSVLAELRTLADGAKLVVMNGRSHVCYLREEPAGLRLSIDGKTCLFPKEYDPTRLTSSVSGKLVRYLVQNEERVTVGQPYVELEVMKMYLTLTAPESGKITITNTEGTSVEIGEVIATLELDDPSKVRRSEKFTGNLPDFNDPQAVGLKPHQQFSASEKELKLLLRGFDAKRSAIVDYVNTIDDVRVCSGEIRETLSFLSGRISTDIQKTIESELNALLTTVGVKNGNDFERGEKFRGCFSNSSSTEVKQKWIKQSKAVSSSIARILALCRDVPAASELIETASKYSSGSVLGSSIAGVLDEYLKIEKTFARRTGGSADALFALRDGNKKDLSSIVEIAASHIRLREKNSSLVKFLEVLSRPALSAVLSEDNAQTAEFKARLHQLSQLYAPEYSDIALRARIMVADLRRPHFHHRKTSVESMLETIVRAPHDRGEEEIQQMVRLGDSILDVLVSFVLPFDRSVISPAIRSAATQVYLRRSYRAYDVTDLRVFCSESGSTNATLAAKWRFRFLKRDDSGPALVSMNGVKKPRAPISRGIVSFDSADNLSQASGGASTQFDDEPYRDGRLAAFESWSSMENEFDSILESYASELSSSIVRDVNVLTVLLRWDSGAPPVTPGNSQPEQPGTGNTRDNFDADKDPFRTENLVSKSISAFCKGKASRMELAKKSGIKSVTFIVIPGLASESVTYPGFYTFRVRNEFEEDPIYRHIDPPMAFQLELSRLSNFTISRFGYPNRSIHVFFAQDKSTTRMKKRAELVSSTKKPPLGDVPGREQIRIGDKSQASRQASRSGRPLEGSAKSTNVASSRDRKKHDTRFTRDIDARFFVRAVIRQADVFSNPNNGAVVSMPEAERTFMEALDAVEMANCDRRFRRTDFNHIFLNVVPALEIEIEDVEAICRRMFQRYAARLWSLRVFAVEIKVPALVAAKNMSNTIIPLRFILFNPTGHMLRVESYVETVDPNTGEERFVTVSNDSPGSLHGSLVSEPYPVMDRIQRRRVVAQAMETTYVYDFLHIFTKQLHQIWRRYSEDRLLGGFHRHKMPSELIESKELILAVGSTSMHDAELAETSRKPGLNDIGMVAWSCLLRTPEYPNGRQIIIIANDITFRSGSFGPEEDALFCAASRMARERGLPRIYLAANSGARIGVADEVRERLQVDWIDPSAPTKGFRCLAIKNSDVEDIGYGLKTGKKIGANMHELTDIIGAEHGIGVENLMGSGLIAGETSRAYEETFTLSYVSSRSVGIGAYLVRLGQRVIQKKSAAPIILTGYSALNKVLGHGVYISNEQLGGTKVMHPNGITHTVVDDDVQGVGAVLRWLSYIPKTRGEKLPIVESRDPVTRAISARPPPNGQAYDPRCSLVAGEMDSSGDQRRFLGGLFDKDSWEEYLDGWAKTVIVGRARLGGVPAGVVTVETRSVERVTPADPASPDTRESLVTQAGQVWYPDSAAKTAQAIKDFDREGLPLFILANWRGFSGGMRDMFDEILKSGSLIVDALRCYKQPVFVYIPPGGELRGGAWVVLDTLINPEMIEMYADPTSRGGVLEPEGTVDVKYRRRHLIKTMHQLDPKLQELDEELNGANQAGAILSDERKQSIHEAIYAREVEILPMYKNVATSFCDLHDKPGRLLAKGAIRSIIDWQEARSFFYWRLQRRLAEERVRSKVREADPNMTSDKIKCLLRKWAADFRIEAGVSHHGAPNGVLDDGSENPTEPRSFEDDDSWVFHWLEVEEDAIQRRIEKIRTSRIAADVNQCSKGSKEGFVDGIEAALRSCKTNSERAELIAAIQEKISLVNSTRSHSLSSFGIFSKLGKLGWDREGENKVGEPR